jgi:hypothetical protein
MAAAIASGVALAGASIGREQAPGLAAKAPAASLSVVNLRSRIVASQSLSSAARFKCGCSGVRDAGQRRGGRRFMPRSAAGRVSASSAVEDKVSQGELPHSDNRNREGVAEFRVSSVLRVRV